MELQKTIESLKRYINSQEQKLDDYYRMDEEFYKDEIEQLELSLKLLRTVLNHLTKQEKMIELMALALAETEFDKCCDYCHTDVCTAHDDVDERAVCIKQYLEKKAEESE